MVVLCLLLKQKMKRIMKKWMVVVLITLTTLALTSSGKKGMSNPAEDLYTSLLDVSADGTSTLILKNLDLAFVIAPATLTAQEKSWLVKMGDEEKLAKDVYTFLYQKWGTQIFSRIAEAENNHLNAVLRLQTYYGETVSASGEVGKFDDPEIQSLYDQLIAKGSESLAEAYKAGALIEEMDIMDLREILAVTENENIRIVFENLERGSQNHLRAFHRQLTTLGIVYSPVNISATDYIEIVTSAVEKGNQYRMRTNRHQGNGMGRMKRGNN